MLKFGTRNPSAILVLCTDKRDGNNLRDNTTCSCLWGMRCKLLVRWFKQNNIYPKKPHPKLQISYLQQECSGPLVAYCDFSDDFQMFHYCRVWDTISDPDA